MQVARVKRVLKLLVYQTRDFWLQQRMLRVDTQRHLSSTLSLYRQAGDPNTSGWKERVGQAGSLLNL